MGLMLQNRKAYAEAKNGDIWREVYDRMDTLRIKPTMHKVKSHMGAAEVAAYGIRNSAVVEWPISNEAVDAAAAA